ncbi:MAG: phage tail tape measure protein [Huintestinicola sp.]
MSETKGVKIRFEADDSKLQSSLKSIESESKKLQKSLKEIDRLLELDPSNTTLLTKKQELLSKSIENTSKQLQSMEASQEKITAGYKNWEKNKDAIETIKESIVDLRRKQDELTENYKEAQKAYEAGLIPEESLSKARKAVDDVKNKIRELKSTTETLKGEDGLVNEDVYQHYILSTESLRINLQALNVQQEQLNATLNGTDNATEDAAAALDEERRAAEQAAQEEAARKRAVEQAAAADKKAKQAAKDYSQALDNLKNSASKVKDDIKSMATAVATGVTAIGSAVAAGTTAATKVGMEFTSSMSNVKALSGATVEEFEALENAAAYAGANTSKTASEAADALGYMALAGWDTTQMLDGLMPVLRASEAGSMDLATCSDLVTDSMSAMGIAVGDLNHYLDVCTKAQSSSNTSLQQLLQAYIGCGGTLKNLNVSMEESAAVLGTLANRGIKGAEAGTALNSILVNLVGANKNAASAMKELGVSAWDENGNFIGLANTLKVLNGALADCTDEEKNLFEARIGGKTQMDTLQALISGVAGEYDNLNEKLNNANGALEATAKTMQDNLTGDITTLKSTLEGVGITIYNSLEEPFRSAAKEAIDSIRGLNSNLSDGEMAESIKRIAEAFSELLKSAAEFAADDAIPDIINSLEWIADHSDFVISGLTGMGAAWVTWKLGNVVLHVKDLIAAIKLYKTASAESAAAQAALTTATEAVTASETAHATAAGSATTAEAGLTTASTATTTANTELAAAAAAAGTAEADLATSAAAAATAEAGAATASSATVAANAETAVTAVAAGAAQTEQATSATAVATAETGAAAASSTAAAANTGLAASSSAAAASQAQLAAAAKMTTMAHLAMGAAIVSVVALLAKFIASKIDAAAEELRNKNKLSETTQALYDQAKAYEETTAAIKTNAAEADHNAEASYNQWNAIKALVDENGRAKGSVEGLENAVSRLNAISGQNIEVVNGQIVGYQDLEKSMSEVIETARKQAKLDFMGDSYSEAVSNIDQVTEDIEKSKKKLQELVGTGEYANREGSKNWLENKLASGELTKEEKKNYQAQLDEINNQIAETTVQVSSLQSLKDDYSKVMEDYETILYDRDNEVLHKDKAKATREAYGLDAKALEETNRENAKLAAMGVKQSWEDLVADLENLDNDLAIKNVSEEDYWAKRRKLLEDSQYKENAEWHKYYDKVQDYYDKLSEEEKKAADDKLKEQKEKEKEDLEDKIDALKLKAETEESYTKEMLYNEMEILISGLDKEDDIYKKYNEEIIKGRKALADETSKTLKEGLKTDVSEIESQIKKVSSEYQTKVKDLLNAKQTYFNKLFDTSEFTSKSTQTVNGKEAEVFGLADPGEALKKLQAYQKAYDKLKSRDVSDNVLAWIDTLDQQTAKDTIDVLNSMSDTKFADYNKNFDEYKNTAEQMSANKYDAEIQQLNKDFVQNVTDLLDTLPEKAKSAGKYTAEGFAEGITIGSADITTAVNDMTQNTLDAIKKGLDINSPSKETESLGEYTAKGFVNGFNSESMAGAVDDFADTFIAKLAEKDPDIRAAMESTFTGNMSAVLSDMNSLASKALQSISSVLSQSLPQLPDISKLSLPTVEVSEAVTASADTAAIEQINSKLDRLMGTLSQLSSGVSGGIPVALDLTVDGKLQADMDNIIAVIRQKFNNISIQSGKKVFSY